MRLVHRSGEKAPGTWWPVFGHPDHDKPVGAGFTCPLCERQAYIMQPDHSIAGDGTVSPSVVCVHGECSFHDWLKLDGWTEALET